MRFNLEVDAIPEGTVVFANEPLLRIKGPLLQAQIVETALLNMINFQTLVATKSARVCQAAKGDAVLEFGLRRAQGVDGAISASRAAFVGGCAATSNVLAGKVFGIPIKGTHAHSWVMSFDSELEAFEAYAKAMPNNCVFLVDTYDTLDGVRHAIEVGKAMRQRGHEMAGIRLDSGDLAYLSIETRKMLDAAGFKNAKILASNDLDEHLIADLKQQGATIGIWGVGTKLVTAYDQPALGGVYKLAALRDADKSWRHKIKLAEGSGKVSIPGILQVRRYRNNAGFIADAIYDTLTGIGDATTIIDPADATRQKPIAMGTAFDDLLVPIFRDGKCVYEQPPLPQVRERALNQLAQLHPSVKRFTNPHRYPAGLEKELFDLRAKLIFKAKSAIKSETPMEEEPAAVEETPAAVPLPEPAFAQQPLETSVAPDDSMLGGESPAAMEDTTEEEREAQRRFGAQIAATAANESGEFPPVNPAPRPHPEVAPSKPPAPASAPHGDQQKPKPQVTIPPRPKFAGIGAKHGQVPPGSTVKVNVKRAVRPNPFFKKK
jgi:nicotinate phosphoribosyltransferase